MLICVIVFGDKSMCATYTHAHTRNTRVKKTCVYYTKVSDDGKTATYVFSLFGRPVYLKVRYREKMGKNMFVWVLDPAVEKVGLTLEEVSGDGEA
jgi:hypothetical protein